MCVPLVGLKACIDRVVLPAPERCIRKLGPRPNYHSGALVDSYNLHDHNYGYDSYRSDPYSRYEQSIPLYSSKIRSKRQLPIVRHGYKFFMNMIPPFMREPLENTVNIMALTHPERKEANFKYAMILPENFRKIIPSNTRGNMVPSVQQRKNANLRSLLKKHKENFLLRPRVSFESDELDSEETNSQSWIQELNARDILDRYSGDNSRSVFDKRKKSKIASKLSNLIKERVHKGLMHRAKRSFVMDSEELSMPLYQLKVEDYPEEDSFSQEYEPKHMEEPLLQRRRIGYRSRDREDEILRRVIKDELRKFKKIDRNEESRYKKTIPHSPIFHLLNFPLKFFRNFDSSNNSPLTAVPKMIVETKKYFRDFGRNFKKHALHLASDIIGDFDHEPYANIQQIFKPTRYRRDIPKDENAKASHDFQENMTKNFTVTERYNIINDENKKKVENDDFTNAGFHPMNAVHSANLGNILKKWNFFNVSDLKGTRDHKSSDNEMKNFRSGSENKVRKKRYIVKVVDEDEIEDYLRRKLGKLYNIPLRPKKSLYLEERHSQEETWSVEETNVLFNRKAKSEEANNYPHKKISVEKVRPKLIIDNNGLPFMEMNGFKRPILMKNTARSRANHHSEDLVGGSHFIPIDSSEEVDRDKIDHIIGYARNNKKNYGKNNDIPINTIKKKMSDLLYETNVLVYTDFWKYHEIYDDFLELEYIKASIVQDWKRIVMEKRINCHISKVNLLGKFKSMQHIKDIAVKNIVDAMYKESASSFILGEFVKMLIKLHKLQCIINKVVGCFEEKFKMGTKFDVQNEIKFVDFLARLNFAGEKTRNDMIAKLKELRDDRLQENIQLLDKLKKSLIEEDEPCIDEKANLVWEIKNIEKMRKRTIEEMHLKLLDGYRIKKHMKILFDLTKRLQSCEKELKDDCKKDENVRELQEDTEEETITDSKNGPVKKFSMEEFKQKLQEKMEKYKEIVQERKEKLLRMYKKDSEENE